MNSRYFCQKVVLFFAAFVLLYVLIYLSNFIFWVRRFEYYSFEEYLIITTIFSFMVTFKFWVSAGIFGAAVIAGNIVQYNIIRSQGPHITMAGGFAFMGILLTGLIFGVICQYLVLKSRKHKRNKQAD